MSVDESLFLTINGLAGRSPVLDQFFLLLGTRSTLYIPAALAIGYWVWKNWREALIGGGALAGVLGLVDFLAAQLKWVFERVRPCRALSEAVTVGSEQCGGLFSFPSNHTANTAAAAAFLHVLYPKSGWVTWPIVALVGFARVYVGAHYVTDVLGGWVLGGICGMGSAGALLCWSRFRASARIANPAEGSPPPIR